MGWQDGVDVLLSNGNKIQVWGAGDAARVIGLRINPRTEAIGFLAFLEHALTGGTGFGVQESGGA